MRVGLESQSAVVVINADAHIPDSLKFGKKLSKAVDEFKRSRKPAPIYINSYDTHIAWVVSLDIKSDPQVVVVREATGRAVTALNAHQEDLEAMINVLRKHGYTCIRRSA